MFPCSRPICRKRSTAARSSSKRLKGGSILVFGGAVDKKLEEAVVDAVKSEQQKQLIQLAISKARCGHENVDSEFRQRGIENCFLANEIFQEIRSSSALDCIARDVSSINLRRDRTVSGTFCEDKSLMG